MKSYIFVLGWEDIRYFVDDEHLELLSDEQKKKLFNLVEEELLHDEELGRMYNGIVMDTITEFFKTNENLPNINVRENCS